MQKEFKCILCGSKFGKVVINSIKSKEYNLPFSLYQCKKCGLIHTYPKLEAKDLKWLYSESYYGETERETFLKNRIVGKIINRISCFLLKRRVQRVSLGRCQGRILDLGCGSGRLLVLFLEKGWEVYGVDISKAACISTKKKVGKNVFCGELEDQNFPSDFFDMVILWHVIEHIPDPRKVLKEIRRILKKDGILVLALPNIESLQFKIFRKYWFPLDVPRHLYHFSPRTIKRLLELSGFDVVKLRNPRLEVLLSPFYSTLKALTAVLNIKDFKLYYCQNRKKSLRILYLVLATIFLPFLLVFFQLVLLFLPNKGETLEIYCKKKLYSIVDNDLLEKLD